MPAGALSRERIGAHLLHLAGPRLPDELDPHTVNLHEQGNLPWFIRATAERLDRLAPKLGAAAPAGAAGEVGVLDRLVVMRCLTLGFFERSAASRGDVGAWCGVVVDLLTAINRIANTPARRRAIDAGSLPPTEAKILSGARKAVSDIIRANPLF